MKRYPFNALLARMKYIARWGLMRSSRTESLSEHTADTAILAHTLCVLSKTMFSGQARPETVAVAALYPVSYTHLDVYKRQLAAHAVAGVQPQGHLALDGRLQQ